MGFPYMGFHYMGFHYMGFPIFTKGKVRVICVLPRYLRTAVKFRKKFLEKNQKTYYFKHRSKSKRRLFVTGGSHLKESGVYTPAFCQCVIDIWVAAHDKPEDTAFTKKPVAYQKLWDTCFSRSVVREDLVCVENVSNLFFNTSSNPPNATAGSLAPGTLQCGGWHKKHFGTFGQYAGCVRLRSDTWSAGEKCSLSDVAMWPWGEGRVFPGTTGLRACI